MTGLLILISAGIAAFLTKASIDAFRMLSPMIREEGADTWDIF